MGVSRSQPSSLLSELEVCEVQKMQSYRELLSISSTEISNCSFMVLVARETGVGKK